MLPQYSYYTVTLRPICSLVSIRHVSRPAGKGWLCSQHSVFISLFTAALLPQPTHQYIYDTAPHHSFLRSLFPFSRLISHFCPLIRFLSPEGLRSAGNRSPDSFFTLPQTGNSDKGKIMRNCNRVMWKYKVWLLKNFLFV